jgi:hypothetical protein
MMLECRSTPPTHTHVDTHTLAYTHTHIYTITQVRLLVPYMHPSVHVAVFLFRCGHFRTVRALYLEYLCSIWFCSGMLRGIAGGERYKASC